MAFWGFCVSIAGCLVWYWYHGMRLGVALAVLVLMFSWFLVYARVVAQGGVTVVRNMWVMPQVIEGIAGAGVFSRPGAVIASMQNLLLMEMPSTVLAPMAMNAFRISQVFKKRRRLFVPALFAAILVAMACTGYIVLSQAYRHGAVNFGDTWPVQQLPKATFGEAQRIINFESTPHSRFYLRPFSIGVVGMGSLMFMRARFYWWPIHSLGLLCLSSWNMSNRLWFPFFLGWLAKASIMRFAGGR
ncbi:unnamed protein product, partial [marine sediment metagenome]